VIDWHTLNVWTAGVILGAMLTLVILFLIGRQR